MGKMLTLLAMITPDLEEGEGGPSTELMDEDTTLWDENTDTFGGPDDD